MRQSSSIRFNYGGIQGNTYTQPNRATTSVLRSQPPPTYPVSQSPIHLNQPSPVHLNQPISNNELQGSYNRELYGSEKVQSSTLAYENLPSAQEEEFTPGCCGKGSSGVVYESHEKSQPFC